MPWWTPSRPESSVILSGIAWNGKRLEQVDHIPLVIIAGVPVRPRYAGISRNHPGMVCPAMTRD